MIKKRSQKIKNKEKNTPINKFDYTIFLIFIFSIIVPIIISYSQKIIVQYGDDIVMLSWVKSNHSNLLDIFETKIGTGYRPIGYLIYVIIFNLSGGVIPFYYYLSSGLMFSVGMVFLYLLGKELHSKMAGIVAVLLYLFLDASFILISKINFIVTTGEIMFITSALYFSILYFKTNNKNYKWCAIILSIFAFLTKEPSILIIPTFVLTYLYLNKKLNNKHIILCIIPFIYVFIEMVFISPDVGAGSTNLIQRIISNVQFYFDTEINSQFKTPILIGISVLAAIYSISYGKFKNELIVCIMWFIVGILPFLITQQPVQPTYLAEANLGMVLLIGIVISQNFKSPFKVEPIIPILLIIGILFQITYVPQQITNMQGYNKMISNNQNVFLKTILEIKNIPENEKVFYISNEIRTKNGGYQITEDFFKQYLCLKDMCYVGITTNYTEANYIILPSSADIQIFQKEYPNESNKLQIIKQIQLENEYGFILKKV